MNYDPELAELLRENSKLRERCKELQQKIDNMASEQVAGRKGRTIMELRARIAELENAEQAERKA